MNEEIKKEPVKLTPKAVLLAMQKAMTLAVEKSNEYSADEPFPIEVNELFLYTPDGDRMFLSFQYLGNDCVLSEKEITVEHNGKIVVFKERLMNSALEFLFLRIKTLYQLGF